MSRPRAATSVAISVVTLPDSNWASERCRAFCDMFPCRTTVGTPVLARELPRKLVGAVLGANEDERQSALTLELLGELGKLVLERDREELVGDLAEPDVLAVLGADAARFARVGIDQVGDGPVERRREEHRLPVQRHAREDAVDLRAEAHVEHAVGFVEHEDADAGERDRAPLEQVVQAAGRRDEDLGAARLLRLARDRGAAVDGRRPGGREPCGERLELGDDLAGELARRDENEGSGGATVDRRCAG